MDNSKLTDAKEIISSLEKQFNGDENHDLQIVSDYIKSLKSVDDNTTLIAELGRYCTEKFPNADAIKDAKKIEESILEFQKKIQAAQSYLKEQKFEEAVAAFDELIGENQPPVSKDKRYYSFTHPFEEMLVRASTGNDERPIERISALPELLYYQKATALFELKRYDEAKDTFQSCLKLNPADARVYFELAQVAKAQGKLDEIRDLLKQMYCYLFTRHQLARFYREYAHIAMMEERFDLAVALVYLSIDYEDAQPARAMLNAIAKHRGVNLSKPTPDEVKKRLTEGRIPVGPCPSVYNLAIDIGKTMRKPYPQVAKMAFAIAYDITHYEPLLKELQ